MNEDLRKDVADNAKNIAILQERDKAFEQRLQVVEDIVKITYDLVANVKELITEVKRLGESIKGQGERIGALENKPGKKWDGIVDKIIMLVVGAVVAFMLSKIGF